MNLKPKLPNWCECGEEMIVLMVKALAWEHLGKAAALLQCGPHIDPSLDWLTTTILDRDSGAAD